MGPEVQNYSNYCNNIQRWKKLKKKQRNLLREVYKLEVGKEFPYIRVKLHIRLSKTEIQHVIKI